MWKSNIFMDCGDRVSWIARVFFITNFTPIHIFVTSLWRCKFVDNDKGNETKYKIHKKCPHHMSRIPIFALLQTENKFFLH